MIKIAFNKEKKIKIKEAIEILDLKYKIFNENFKIENKFKSTNNEKWLVFKLIKVFKEIAHEIKDKFIKNATKSKLNVIITILQT